MTGGRGHVIASVAGRHQLWQVNPHLHYRGDQRDWGPIGSLRWCCWRGRRRGTKHSRGTQAGDKRGLMKGLRAERADWESVRKRTDWNSQVIKWLLHQSRPCLRAKVSAVKLEAIGPVEKDRELDVLHLEHVTYTPAPLGPKREGTEPSVHT